MKIIRAAQRSAADVVREVAQSVRSGGTVIFPTDTVYGMGCDPENNAAIDAIYRAKGRSSTKPLALHVADIMQALPYVDELTASASIAIEQLWPGPVAIIVRRNDRRFTRGACGFATVSLRCPDHELCRALLHEAGPLAATSANRSGAKPFLGDDDADALAALPEASLAVLAGATPLRRESTIIDCTGDQPKLVREGAVPADAIAKKLGTLGPVR